MSDLADATTSPCLWCGKPLAEHADRLDGNATPRVPCLGLKANFVPSARASSPLDPFAVAPPWFKWALAEVGTRELPGNTGPAIRRYISLAHAGGEGDPWCAIFANAALESCGLHGTRSASSQSFRHDAGFLRLAGPALGAIAVFWRESKASWLGHVGFYRGELDGHVWVLGGNEGDMVQIEALPLEGATMGLRGYWWPVGVPLPEIRPVVMPHGSASHQQIAPKVT
jgi:uncharacterized protein (TIGR02594 family)